MLRRTLMPIAAAATLIAACGEDEDAGTATRTASAAGAAAADDAARYCRLTRELDRAGSEFFAALEGDEDATPEDYEAAERAMVVELAPKLAEVEAAAPAEIKPEVAVLLSAQRERAGLAETRTPDAKVEGAESALKAFEKRAC